MWVKSQPFNKLFPNYRSEDTPQHFRQRSGSLESQSQFLTEMEPPVPAFTFSQARRSNSTEVLDDGSSYTSQSSVEYSIPGNHNHRRRARGRHRKDLYANTGSMPNLAQPDTRCYAYQARARPTTTAYYVTGYPSYADPEPYTNGGYMYDNEMEGHYNVNPAYHPTPSGYHSHDVHAHYGNDEMDGMSQNPYATLRPPRNRPAPRSNEHVGKNIQKALVAEHLRGWYQRNAAYKQPAYNYDYDRGSQQSLGYQTMPAPYGHSNRNTSYSSGQITAPYVRLSGALCCRAWFHMQVGVLLTCTVLFSPVSSSGNWHNHMSGGGMLEYDTPVHAPQSYSYSTAPYSHSAHNRWEKKTSAWLQLLIQ